MEFYYGDEIPMGIPIDNTEYLTPDIEFSRLHKNYIPPKLELEPPRAPKTEQVYWVDLKNKGKNRGDSGSRELF